MDFPHADKLTPAEHHALQATWMRSGPWLYFETEDPPGDEGDRGPGKLTHHAINIETGKRVEIDYSPNAPLPRCAFDTFVRLGFPTRTMLGLIGPLRESDLLRIEETRLVHERAA